MKRFGEVLMTGLCTALIIGAMKLGLDTVNAKFDKQDERSKKIEDKLGQYITKDEFNQILEAKLKQFKVSKEGRLIVAPSQ